jgi:hypothetical protein
MSKIMNNNSVIEIKKYLQLPLKYQLESSMLKEVGFTYTNGELGNLEVEFNDKGQVYIYENVTENVFNELRNSHSPGKYFLSNIRDSYDFKRLK